MAEREDVLPRHGEAVSDQVAALDRAILLQGPLRVSPGQTAMVPLLLRQVGHERPAERAPKDMYV